LKWHFNRCQKEFAAKGGHIFFFFKKKNEEEEDRRRRSCEDNIKLI